MFLDKLSQPTMPQLPVSRSEITLNSSGYSALTKCDRIWKVLAQLCAGQALYRWPLCTLAHCWHHLPSSHWQPINHLIWGVIQFEALVTKFIKIKQRCIIIIVNKLRICFLCQYFYISFKNSIENSVRLVCRAWSFNCATGCHCWINEYLGKPV